jgi:hypothetical protein
LLGEILAKPIRIIVETEKERRERINQEFQTLWLPLIKLMFFYGFPGILLFMGIGPLFMGKSSTLESWLILIGGLWLGLVIFFKFIRQRKKSDRNEHQGRQWYKQWYIWVIVILVIIIIFPKHPFDQFVNSYATEPKRTLITPTPTPTPTPIEIAPQIRETSMPSPTTTIEPAVTNLETKEQVKAEWEKPALPGESIAEKIDRIKNAYFNSTKHYLDQSEQDVIWNIYGIKCQGDCDAGIGTGRNFYGFHILSRDWADCECRDGSNNLVDISNATRQI